MRLMKGVPVLLLIPYLAGLTGLSAAELQIDRSSGPVRLGINGEVGRTFILESSRDPASVTSWKFLLELTLTNRPHLWFDPASSIMPQRFYRATQLDGDPPPTSVQNFRLLDHLGQSQELFYHTQAPAIILLFLGDDCARLQQVASAIKSLSSQWADQGVIFWMLDSNPQHSRPEIAAMAATLGVDLPILQDDLQAVAREFGVISAPEVVCINPADWTIFYRGAIQYPIAPEAAEGVQNYLAVALANFLSSQVVSPSRTASGDCAIAFAPRKNVSYATDIAPLLQHRCVRCHSPGNIAPWSMTNYAIVKLYAAAIKDKVMTRAMPPWHADPFYGTFANDLAMSREETTTLLQWIDDGAPPGNGPDPLAATPPPPAPDWPLGTPDYIISIPRQSIPASGVVAYRYLNVDSLIPSDVWLRAAVVRPSNPTVVHHCLVFAGSNIPFGGLGGFFGAYLPGAVAVPFPDGTGKFLPKGSTILFQMHYTTTGQDEVDETQLGLYLAPAKPARELQTRAAFTINIAIPPYAKNYEREASYQPSASKDVLLYEMSPHMHYRGSWFTYEAQYPDGTKEILLSVPKYVFHWQTLYRFAQPKRLPAGTRILCRGGFDNSIENLENPDPSKLVTFGEQTFNEMFVGYLNFAEIP